MKARIFSGKDLDLRSSVNRACCHGVHIEIYFHKGYTTWRVEGSCDGKCREVRHKHVINRVPKSLAKAVKSFLNTGGSMNNGKINLLAPFLRVITKVVAPRAGN